MTKLSEHFSLEEFTFSETANKYGIKNTPTAAHLNTMKHTCNYLLEPLRNLLCKEYKTIVYIKITSGYRSAALNTKIPGASSTSAHCKGEAADLEAYYFVNNKKIIIQYTTLYELIKKWVKEKKISVDQCICEKSGSAVWVHAAHSSWGKTRDRHQFLKYNGKSYVLDTVIKW